MLIGTPANATPVLANPMTAASSVLEVRILEFLSEMSRFGTETFDDASTQRAYALNRSGELPSRCWKKRVFILPDTSNPRRSNSDRTETVPPDPSNYHNQPPGGKNFAKKSLSRGNVCRNKIAQQDFILAKNAQTRHSASRMRRLCRCRTQREPNGRQTGTTDMLVVRLITSGAIAATVSFKRHFSHTQPFLICNA